MTAVGSRRTAGRRPPCCARPSIRGRHISVTRRTKQRRRAFIGEHCYKNNTSTSTDSLQELGLRTSQLHLCPLTSPFAFCPLTSSPNISTLLPLPEPGQYSRARGPHRSAPGPAWHPVPSGLSSGSGTCYGGPRRHVAARSELVEP